MSKYYLALEQEAQKPNVSIDESIKQLICEQQDSGFGFREYWQKDYTLDDFCAQYKNDFLQRAPYEKRKELEFFIDKEKNWQNNLMVSSKDIFSGKLQLGAYKNLWRAFRRIGFRGTKLKGDPDAVNDGCFLCIQNTPDQQKGMRVAAPDNSINHVVLMNPFPILTDQVTIASLCHEPQELTAQHLEFILSLTERSKKFKYSFNGIGAGASIPDHFHFYGFIGSLPIEQVEVAASIIELDNILVHQLDKDWPFIALVATGDKDQIASYLLELTEHLEQQNISLNVIFTRDNNSKAKVYVIPRRKPKPQPHTGFNNEFGVVEMSGLIVCESSEAFRTADIGRVVEAMKQVAYPNTESDRARLLYGLLGSTFFSALNLANLRLPT